MSYITLDYSMIGGNELRGDYPVGKNERVCRLRFPSVKRVYKGYTFYLSRTKGITYTNSLPSVLVNNARVARLEKSSRTYNWVTHWNGAPAKVLTYNGSNRAEFHTSLKSMSRVDERPYISYLLGYAPVCIFRKNLEIHSNPHNFADFSVILGERSVELGWRAAANIWEKQFDKYDGYHGKFEKKVDTVLMWMMKGFVKPAYFEIKLNGHIVATVNDPYLDGDPNRWVMRYVTIPGTLFKGRDKISFVAEDFQGKLSIKNVVLMFKKRSPAVKNSIRAQDNASELAGSYVTLQKQRATAIGDGPNAQLVWKNEFTGQPAHQSGKSFMIVSHKGLQNAAHGAPIRLNGVQIGRLHRTNSKHWFPQIITFNASSLRVRRTNRFSIDSVPARTGIGHGDGPFSDFIIRNFTVFFRYSFLPRRS